MIKDKPLSERAYLSKQYAQRAVQQGGSYQTPLSERAYLSKQYAQRTVKNETRRLQIPSPLAEKVASGGTSYRTLSEAEAPPDDGRGTSYKHCHTFWFAPQTGHWHWGASLYSSLRLLPIYVRSLREQFVIYNFIFFIFLSFLSFYH